MPWLASPCSCLGRSSNRSRWVSWLIWLAGPDILCGRPSETTPIRANGRCTVQPWTSTARSSAASCKRCTKANVVGEHHDLVSLSLDHEPESEVEAALVIER
jgi:hypothetical protein